MSPLRWASRRPAAPLTVPAGQSAELRAFTFPGNILFARLAAPGEVIGLTTVVTGSDSVALSWQTPGCDDEVSSYIVNYRMTSVGGAWTSQSTTETALSVSGLAAATQYDFAVIAVNSTGNEPPSRIITATTASGGDYLLTTGFLPVAGSTRSCIAGGIGVNARDNSAPVDGSHIVPASVMFAWSLSNIVAPTAGLVAATQFTNDGHNCWGVYPNGPGSPGDYYL
jgi:Fibronectin type III domain